MLDCITIASRELSTDDLGMFVALLWECWNARNRFIFGSQERDAAQLSKRTATFVMSYRQMKEKTTTKGGWPSNSMDSSCNGLTETEF